MKSWPAALFLLLLSACTQEAPKPHKEMTISTGSAENAISTWNAARTWLLSHGYGVLDKPNANNITYVMKNDQNIAVILHRSEAHPTLVNIKVAERTGNNFGAKSEATYAEITSIVKSHVKEVLRKSN